MKKLLLSIALLTLITIQAHAGKRPNVVLVMADDQGWGQTGYYNHPVLETPNLDSMAENGLRLDRFYAGACTCSPTRASVMTGRTNNRTGVYEHGWGLNKQEKTIAQAMRNAGYYTAHFGKWHLNYLRGAGVPILEQDPHGPGKFGFDYWLSVTNFFDIDPLMSRNGKFERLKGDSSEVVVSEALKYMEERIGDGKPFFTVIWFGSPHSPFQGLRKDVKLFPGLDEGASHHHAELVAMDRSIGTLRKGLRKLGIADNTILWFNSDNGGLPKVGVDSVGGLRGHKGTLYEGGLRVPCVIEWPNGIKPRVSGYPACTIDIFPTIVSILGLDRSVMNERVDGIDISPLFQKDIGRRTKPIPFSQKGTSALVDNQYKLLKDSDGQYFLYNLDKDAVESTNLLETEPVIAASMKKQLESTLASIEASEAGADYPEGVVLPSGRERIFWAEYPPYKPYLEMFSKDDNLKRYVDR